MAGNPRAAKSQPCLNHPGHGERQPPLCLSLPCAKYVSSQTSALGRRGGCLGYRAGMYPTLPLAECQDAFPRTDMSQAPVLPAGAIYITVGVNPSSGEG